MLYPLSYGSDQTYFEEIKQFYYRDEFSHQVQEWNRQRTMAIERALQQFLYVQMAKELKNKLLAEAKEYVIKVRTGTRPFSSVQSLSCVQLFVSNPMNCSTPGRQHNLQSCNFPRLELKVKAPVNSCPVANGNPWA